MSIVVTTEKETLRGLLAQSNELFNQLIEQGGELTPDLEAQLSNLQISVPDKVDSYSHLMDRLDTEAEHWKQKAEFYAVIMKACLKTREKIKNNLKYAMLEAGLDEIKGNDVRFKLSNSKASLLINESEIEPAYKIQVVETVVDKKKIEEDLKIGVPVKGAQLVASSSIRVYANKAVK